MRFAYLSFIWTTSSSIKQLQTNDYFHFKAIYILRVGVLNTWQKFAKPWKTSGPQENTLFCKKVWDLGKRFLWWCNCWMNDLTFWFLGPHIVFRALGLHHWRWLHSPFFLYIFLYFFVRDSDLGTKGTVIWSRLK